MKLPERPYPSFALVMSQMSLSDHMVPRQGQSSRTTRALNPDNYIVRAHFRVPVVRDYSASTIQDTYDDEMLVNLDKALFPLGRGKDGRFRRLRLSSLVVALAFHRRR